MQQVNELRVEVECQCTMLDHVPHVDARDDDQRKEYKHGEDGSLHGFECVMVLVREVDLVAEEVYLLKLGLEDAPLAQLGVLSVRYTPHQHSLLKCLSHLSLDSSLLIRLCFIRNILLLLVESHSVLLCDQSLTRGGRCWLDVLTGFVVKHRELPSFLPLLDVYSSRLLLVHNIRNIPVELVVIYPLVCLGIGELSHSLDKLLALRGHRLPPTCSSLPFQLRHLYSRCRHDVSLLNRATYIGPA